MLGVNPWRPHMLYMNAGVKVCLQNGHYTAYKDLDIKKISCPYCLRGFIQIHTDRGFMDRGGIHANLLDTLEFHEMSIIDAEQRILK